MFTDFFGQTLTVGDEVAFERPNYRELVIGTIISLTPKQINIEWYNSSYRSRSTFRTYPGTVVRSPKKTINLLNELYGMIPVEVRVNNPRLVAAREEIIRKRD